MLMPNSKNRKFFLRSRKSKHTSSFSVLSFRLVHFKLWAFSSNFVGHFQNFIGRFQNSKGRNKYFKGRNQKNVRQNYINNTSLFLNDTSFLQKQALVLKKRPITQQKPPKTTIFKAAENRIILNNFFSVPNTALNGGVRNTNLY